MKKVAIFLLFLAAGIIVYSQFSKPSTYTFNFQNILLEGKNLVPDDGLTKAVDEILKDKEGRYGVFIKNLKTNKTYYKNENEIFIPASLYKVWVMGTVFEKIKAGKLIENDPIVADIPLLNKRFGFTQEEAELKEGVLNFTIKSALDQMISISHNYAAMALIEKVGRSEIEAFLKKYGLQNSSMGNTDDLKTTPADLGSFFEKIYKGEVIDPQYSQKMIEILLKQQKNDRIPKYLPKETKIAHKTGELSNIRNDAGIVYSSGGDFVIVVLTETKNVTDASETIAEVSKAVFDYFNR